MGDLAAPRDRRRSPRPSMTPSADGPLASTNGEHAVWTLQPALTFFAE